MTHADVFDELAETIRRAAQNRKIIYIPNSGNWGDGLIRYATKEFFADKNLDHIEVNVAYPKGLTALAPLLASASKYLFVHGGGGAWCTAHSRARRTVGLLTRVTSNVLVLPSTYELRPISQKGTYFRRDKFESADTVPNSSFCHDMAFYLAHQGINYRADPNGPVANMFRTDRESRKILAELPKDNLDLSVNGNHMSNCDGLFRFISKFSTINTDRLHLSIAAALIGCRVNLYSGNYFKIRSIYESSTRYYFPDLVNFIKT